MIPATLYMALVGSNAGGVGPSAAPSSVSLYTYGGDLVGVQWTNGDATASTQLGKSSVQGTEPSAVEATVGAGVTTYETGESTTGLNCTEPDIQTFWWARHIKNGITTAWSESSDYACSGGAA